MANKAETKYAAELEARRIAGEIEWYRFEGIRLRIAAGNAFYCPDFAVMTADGTLQFHEIKGGKLDATGRLVPLAEEAARLRLKVAADVFPFEFIMAIERPKKMGGGFELRKYYEEAKAA